MGDGPIDWSAWYGRGPWPPPRLTRWAALWTRLAAPWARLRVVAALLAALTHRVPRLPSGDGARPRTVER